MRLLRTLTIVLLIADPTTAPAEDPPPNQPTLHFFEQAAEEIEEQPITSTPEENQIRTRKAGFGGPRNTPRTNWSSQASGQFYCGFFGDLIQYKITQGVVAPDGVEFELVLAPGITWQKEINVPDGIGNSWNISLPNTGKLPAARIGLWAHQTKNGQGLSFRKAQTFGLMNHMCRVYELEGLPAGSRVTFTWAIEGGPTMVGAQP